MSTGILSYYPRPYLGQRWGFRRERGSSLQGKLPVIVVIHSLESEPQTKLAGPLRTIHTRHGSKVRITDVG